DGHDGPLDQDDGLGEWVHIPRPAQDAGEVSRGGGRYSQAGWRNPWSRRPGSCGIVQQGSGTGATRRGRHVEAVEAVCLTHCPTSRPTAIQPIDFIIYWWARRDSQKLTISTYYVAQP